MDFCPATPTSSADLSAIDSFLTDCAAALRSHGRKAALLLGGDALVAGGALGAAGRVAAVTGAQLLCENNFSRVDRGAGLPAVKVGVG